jgi:TetR/AcrR family transcriptional repressor of nem operon
MKKSKADTVETRKRIVATASRIFLAQGLAGAGIADIMAAAGMTQGGFYRHFDSKEQLIAEANLAAADQLQQLFEAATAGKAPREALDAIVTMYLDPSEEVSALCSLASLGSELRRSDSGVRATVMRGHERMVDFVAGYTEQLGIPDHAGVANAVVSTMVGAVTIARLAAEPGLAHAILDNASKVVSGLLRPPYGSPHISI